MFMVDANHVDWHGIFRRGRNDDLLRPTSEMQLCLLLLGEDSGGLTDVIRTSGPPPNGARILLVKNLYLGAIDHQELFSTFFFSGDGPIKSLVHAIVLELV